MAAWKELWQLRLDAPVSRIVPSPTGTHLAIVTVDGSNSILCSDTGRVLHELPCHGLGTTSASWRADGSVLATGGQDKTLKFWNPATGACLLEREMPGWTDHLAWAPSSQPNDSWLALASGKKISLYDTDGKCARVLAERPCHVLSLEWKDGGQEFYTGGYEGVLLWKACTGSLVRHFEFKNPMACMSVSSASPWIACGHHDKCIHICNTKKPTDPLRMSGYEAKVTSVSWDHTGRWLATNGGTTPVVWDCSGAGPEGTRPAMLEWHEELVEQVLFEPKSPFLATGDRAGGLAVWQPEKHDQVLADGAVEGPVSALTWIAPGILIASSGSGHIVAAKIH